VCWLQRPIERATLHEIATIKPSSRVSSAKSSLAQFALSILDGAATE
jgi:hypothetical protein